MAEDSIAPPPNQGGGSAKYLIVLLLLIGGGLGVYFGTKQSEPPPEPPPPPVKNAERSTALDDNMMAIPEDEPDAGRPDEAPQPQATPTKKKVVASGDPWECAGDLAPRDITKVLSESQSQIRSCYERELRNDNALQGDLKLQVKIGGDGSVAATRVRGTLNDKKVRECVQNIAKRWTFPAPSGGSCAVFDAPYNFMPKM